MKLYYKNKHVKDIESIGVRFVMPVKFDVEGIEHHIIYFDYSAREDGGMDIEPVKLKKIVISGYETDRYGLKPKYKVTEVPIKQLDELLSGKELKFS